MDQLARDQFTVHVRLKTRDLPAYGLGQLGLAVGDVPGQPSGKGLQRSAWGWTGS